MTAIIPAPTYVLARVAWIPTLVIWHADGRFTWLEGDPCEEYARGARRELAAFDRRHAIAKKSSAR